MAVVTITHIFAADNFPTYVPTEWGMYPPPLDPHTCFEHPETTIGVIVRSLE